MKNFFYTTMLAAGIILASSSTSALLAAKSERSVISITTPTTLSEAVDFHVTAYGTGTDVISGNGSIDIRNGNAWVFIHGQKPSEVISKYIGKKITINGATTVLNQNCMVSIYRDGAVVIPHGPLTNPLTCYTGESYTGQSKEYAQNYQTDLGTMNNKIVSFKLKRGYMATLAQRSDGRGYSRVFIAQDDDIEIPLLQSELKGKVSFIRILKWNWAGKRGYSGTDMAINGALKSSWFYGWDAGNYTRDDREYVVHRHHPGWPGWDEINNKDVNVTHLLGYNEPDNTSDSREHYVAPEDVVAAWPEMLNSGLRIGSPANTSINNHLYTMINGVKANGQRMDFAVVHCYWGGGTPTWVMSQLKALHDNTGLPIWITELNYGANWTTESGWENKDNPTANDLERQRKWMAEMVQLLESSDYIERYAIYNWVQNCRKVYDEVAGKLTPAGVAYSTPETRLAYNPAKEVIPPVVHLKAKGLTATLASSSNTVALTWTDPNGETANYIRVERKLNGGAYETVTQITATENTSFSYNDLLNKEGNYIYRISTSFPNGEILYSDETPLSYFGNQGNDNTSLNVDRTNRLANAGFESTFSILVNSGVVSDRAIYIPEGWSVNYTSGNENDMTILNSGCLASSNFSSIPFTGNAYLARQKWGTSTIEFSQQIQNLETGCYALNAKSWKSGTGGNGILWIQTQDGKKYSTSTSASQTQWQDLSLSFYHSGSGAVTIGFSVVHTENGSETFIGFDNLSLIDNTANRSAEQIYQVLTDLVKDAQTLTNAVSSPYLLGSLLQNCQKVKGVTSTSSRDNLYTIYKELGTLISGLKDQSLPQSNQMVNVNQSGILTNPDFESSFSVMPNSGVTSDRAIYIPSGWTINYTQRDGNDMSILNTSCLNASNFTTIPMNKNAYLVRQKWGTSTIEFSQQATSLSAGYYTLSADAWKSGTGGNGSLWVQSAGSEKQTVSTLGSLPYWQKTAVNFYHNGTGTVAFGFSALHTDNESEAFTGFDNLKLSRIMTSENYTSRVVNPGFEANNGTGWTNAGTVSYNAMEAYNKNFDTYQIISGLLNGTYEISCQGFYRAGSYVAASDSRKTGTENLHALLYANTVSTPLMSIFEGASQNGNVGVSSTYGYIPNTMEQTQNYFAKGLYGHNKVIAQVTNNTLRVGIKKSNLINSDWTIFDNFQIRLIGAPASPATNSSSFTAESLTLSDMSTISDEEPFSIEVENRVIRVTDNKPFDLFTLDGLKIQTGIPLPNGIYLVRCGSKTVKVSIQ